MPLSENEQRILREIEKNLSSGDPNFAKNVGGMAIYRKIASGLKWQILGVIGGLVLMLSMLVVDMWLSFAGFGLMLASALSMDSRLRAIGKFSSGELGDVLRGRWPKKANKE